MEHLQVKVVAQLRILQSKSQLWYHNLCVFSSFTKYQYIN